MDTKAIRQQLKNELGYNSRQVSVKHEYTGYSSSLTFTIRNSEVNFKDLENLKGIL